ncbi:MAG: hypothetical protein IJJ33_03470 [Victivallales bacterium]|nr:hypothetical protein [Victivallales bacterium]
MIPLEKLEGRKFCVVFVKVLDEARGRVQMQCLRGRASVDRMRVSCVTDGGARFQLPSLAQVNILPSDGTPLLKDAEYFCFVKVDGNIMLGNDPLMSELELGPDPEDSCHHDHCDCHHH